MIKASKQFEIIKTILKFKNEQLLNSAFEKVITNNSIEVKLEITSLLCEKSLVKSHPLEIQSLFRKLLNNELMSRIKLPEKTMKLPVGILNTIYMQTTQNSEKWKEWSNELSQGMDSDKIGFKATFPGIDKEANQFVKDCNINRVKELSVTCEKKLDGKGKTKIIVIEFIKNNRHFESVYRKTVDQIKNQMVLIEILQKKI
jgi:hypothetical protein